MLEISCDASDVDVDHAHKVTSPDTYYHNDQVTYSCDSGYEHTDGNITRTCTAMNTWSGDDPLCTSR